MHFVVFFSRSIRVNSLGEWIRENTYVEPTAIAGAFRICVNACIGPVPALETLSRYFPKDLRAANVTSETNGCLGLVLAAASP
jgi:hypothetical protein